MHFVRSVFALTLSFVLLCGCSSPAYVLKPVPEMELETIYSNGKRVLISEKPGSVVYLTNKASPNELRVTLLIENRSGNQIDVFPDSVEAEAYFLRAYYPLIVRSPDEVLDEKRNAQVMKTVALAFSQAAESYHESSNAVARELDEQQDQRENRQLAISQENAYQAFKSSLLRRHTLMPGDTYGGDLYIKGSKINRDPGVEVILQIPVGSDIHKFKLRSPDGNPSASQ